MLGIFPTSYLYDNNFYYFRRDLFFVVEQSGSAIIGSDWRLNDRSGLTVFYVAYGGVRGWDWICFSVEVMAQ